MVELKIWCGKVVHRWGLIIICCFRRTEFFVGDSGDKRWFEGSWVADFAPLFFLSASSIIKGSHPRRSGGYFLPYSWSSGLIKTTRRVLLHTVQTDVSKKISENVPEREHIPLWFLHSPDSSIRLRCGKGTGRDSFRYEIRLFLKWADTRSRWLHRSDQVYIKHYLFFSVHYYFFFPFDILILFFSHWSISFKCWRKWCFTK